MTTARQTRPARPVGMSGGAATARWVSVAGVSPDVGTTTVVGLLALAFASHRRYRIIALDAHPVNGSLATKLATPNASGVDDIAAAAGHLNSFSTVESYLERNSHGAWAATGATSAVPDVGTVRAATAALSPFFALGVLDCGPIGTKTADLLLESAQAPLLVAPVTAEGVLRAACFIDWLSARVDPADGWHCGVALVSTTRRRGAEVGRAAKLLTDRGARVVPVPFDPSLVAGRVNPESVTSGVWAAAQRLGGEMLARAARADTRPSNRWDGTRG